LITEFSFNIDHLVDGRSVIEVIEGFLQPVALVGEEQKRLVLLD
jgi:hypothetical protein